MTEQHLGEYPDREQWRTALLVPMVPLGLTLAVSAIVSVLFTIGMALEDADLPGVAWVQMVLFLPFQLLGMAFGSPLAFETDDNYATFALVPLLLLAVFLWRTIRRGSAAEARSPQVSWANRILLSLGSGAAVGLLLTLVTRILAIRVEGVGVDSSSIWLLMGGTVIAAGAQLLGRYLAIRAMEHPGEEVSDPTDDASLRPAPDLFSGLLLALRHIAIFGAIVAPVVLVWWMWRAESGVPLLQAPAILPTLALLLLGLGHLSAVEGTAQLGDLGDSDAGYLWDVMADHPFMLLLTLLAVALAAILAAVAWYARQDGYAPRDTVRDWARLPGAYAVLGLVLIPLSTLGAGGASVDLTGGVSVRLAWWTPVVLAIWGVIVEALTRYVAPAAAGVIPDGLLRRLLDLDPRPAVVSTVGAATAAGAAESGSDWASDAAYPAAEGTEVVAPYSETWAEGDLAEGGWVDPRLVEEGWGEQTLAYGDGVAVSVPAGEYDPMADEPPLDQVAMTEAVTVGAEAGVESPDLPWIPEADATQQIPTDDATQVIPRREV